MIFDHTAGSEVTACRKRAALAWRRQACFLPEARWWWWRRCWWCAGETVLILGRCWDRPQIRIQLFVRKLEKSLRCWTFWLFKLIHTMEKKHNYNKETCFCFWPDWRRSWRKNTDKAGNQHWRVERRKERANETEGHCLERLRHGDDSSCNLDFQTPDIVPK